MSLYDDIEPTVKRGRHSPNGRNTSESNYDSNRDKDKGYAGSNMFAPRTLLAKGSKPIQPRTTAPSTLRTIYSSGITSPLEPSTSNFSVPPPPFPQQSNSSSTFDFNEIKNKVMQKKLELEEKIKNASFRPPILKAHKVDVSQIKTVPVIPLDVREDTEFLFDEVHIIDEYNPSKPNSYAEFMKSINCNPQFGDDIDDIKLERLIQNEIIDGQNERERSPSPELEKDAVSGTDVAANIMAKMGYTFGSGLGKHGQGMSSALKVEKKGGQAGKIVSEVDEVMRSVGLNPENFQRPITHVLMLRNIYTINDIPEDYDNELRPELSQYGVIKKLILHRDPNAEEAHDQVRVFVDYPNKASAIRAYADLNNRYFSERPIRADFYATDRFHTGHFSDPYN